MIPEPKENIISRAQSPKEGDTFENGEQSIAVTSYSDGVVRYHYLGPKGQVNLEAPIEVWHRLVRKSIESGANFQPA